MYLQFFIWTRYQGGNLFCDGCKEDSGERNLTNVWETDSTVATIKHWWKKNWRGHEEQKGIPCSWIGKINIVQMSILPNCRCNVNVLLMKMPMTFFTEMEKNHATCLELWKLPTVIQFWAKELSRNTTSCYLKIYYKAIIIKTTWTTQ